MSIRVSWTEAVVAVSKGEGDALLFDRATGAASLGAAPAQPDGDVRGRALVRRGGLFLPKIPNAPRA